MIGWFMVVYTRCLRRLRNGFMSCGYVHFYFFIFFLGGAPCHGRGPVICQGRWRKEKLPNYVKVEIRRGGSYVDGDIHVRGSRLFATRHGRHTHCAAHGRYPYFPRGMATWVFLIGIFTLPLTPFYDQGWSMSLQQIILVIVKPVTNLQLRYDC